MQKKIPVNMLRVGMYINLPLSWYEHTFLKSKFTVVSDKQILKIKKTGLAEVIIETDKGIDVADDRVPTDAADHRQTTKPVILDALLEAIHDTSLPASEKATLIHEESIAVMQRLLDNPTAENIITVKKGITDVVNLILKDDTTTQYLLRITSHDFYTYTHSVTVGVLGVALARNLFNKTDRHNLNELGAGFFLHDLGKVHIDQAILNKPGRLTDDEMKEVRRHPLLGFKLLNETRQLTEECKQIVLYHHEREDGRGYPKGLKGEEIHIYGRICTIADVYEALTSDRPYRNKMTPFNALKLMREEMIHHFQPDLFEKFVMMFK